MTSLWENADFHRFR